MSVGNIDAGLFGSLDHRLDLQGCSCRHRRRLGIPIGDAVDVPAGRDGFLELVPSQGRSDGGRWTGSHRVRTRNGLGPTVPQPVDEDSRSAPFLEELGGGNLRRTNSDQRSQAPGNTSGCGKVGIPLDCRPEVKAPRPGGNQHWFEPEAPHHRSAGLSNFPDLAEVAVGWIQIQNQVIGRFQIWQFGSPDVKGDRPLVGKVGKIICDLDDRVGHNTVVLGGLNPQNRLGEVLGGILLEEPLLARSVWVSLEGERASLDPREHQRTDPGVVLNESTLCRSRLREHDLVRIGDLHS